eukprot:TRINITY_DN439_c0_g1_i3.p1 TRINITY_DN439_c0_g1~~TRINITY_DN439_c0_g1_i3.p1  ORF type:complete len:608 (+),score=217.54 TRINITY_DN439_c0_g1_i3:127-1950(+)
MDSSSEGEKSSEELHTEMLKKIGVKMEPMKKKRPRPEAEANEIQPEGEFNAETVGDKLQFSDLLGAIEKNPTKSTISSGKIKKDITRIIQKASKISKPLTKPVRDRVERDVSYKKTQNDMNRWMPQIKHNKEAECMDFTEDVRIEKSLNSIVADRPHASLKNSLEEKVMSVLRKQGLETEEKIKESEQEIISKLSPEEIKERTARLARINRLKMYEEIKNKRAAKIKSKLYHKIKRKNKEHEERHMMQQLEKIDPETAKKIRLKQERERIAEVITMKHSMKGKYAKNLMRFAGMKSNEAKEGIKNMLRIRDELKRKRMEPKEENEDVEEMSEESAEEDGSESEYESGNEKKSEEQSEEESEIRIEFSERKKGQNKKKSEKEEGIFALKFMKDANKREEEQMKQQLQLMAKINKDEDESEEDNVEETKGHIKAPAMKSVQYSIKKLTQKIQSAAEEHEEDTKYSGWTTKPKKQKSAKLEELNLAATNEILDEIQAEISQQKPLLGEELLEGLEEDVATKDILHRAVVVSNANNEEFSKEKEEEIEKSLPPEPGKLLGWGSWAGPDIKVKQVDPEELRRRRLERIVCQVVTGRNCQRRREKTEHWKMCY